MVTQNFCRLASPAYTPRFDPDATPVDVRLLLRIQDWRLKIDTKAKILAVPEFVNLPLPLNYPDMEITLRGTVARVHPAHPVTTAVDHEPDLVDLEEAAIMFNKDIPENPPEVVLQLVEGARTYSGVIKRLTLVDLPGQDRVDYILVFRVTWNVSKPELREWNTAP